MKKIDLPALRAALETLAANERLIDRSMIDLQLEHDAFCIEAVQAALDHIVNDGYRDDEVRGGS